MRVALTGPDGDRGSLGEGLRALGVETASIPFVGVGPPEDRSALERWLRAERPRYDFVVFSSPRAVEAVRRLDIEARLPSNCLCAGPKTAAAADETSFTPLVYSEWGGAGSLLEALDAAPGLAIRGKRIFLPVSDRARPELADGLRERGAIVDVVAVYGVRSEGSLRARVASLAAAGCDAALVASPSAAEALAEGLDGERPAVPPLFAIGATTAKAMEGLGLPVAGTARRATPLGIVTAMKERGMGEFPSSRPRRLRRTEPIRAMFRETRLTSDCLVAPIFVTRAIREPDLRQPIPSMPGVDRVRPEYSIEVARGLLELGVRAVLLFGIPDEKDAEGSGAWKPDGPVVRAIGALKGEFPDLQVWADVCLCEYTDHGHCGVLDEKGRVKNDETLPLLSRAAVAYAKAGADAVCPSDMMDGRVRAIRTSLDHEGLTDTMIVSYAVKYASGFYGPFRDAAGSAPKQGDRRAYQMDPANLREALREAALDEAEGADVLMVKPALAYLDVLRAVKERTNLPVAAYNVSGEYAMVKAAAERGWIDGDRVILETLTAIRRAGADLIVTYHAAEAARLLAKGRTA